MSRLCVALLVCALVAVPALAAEEKKPEAGTVELKGLLMTVKPAKAEFGFVEGMTFDVVLKNTSEKAFQLFDVSFYMYDVNVGTWNCILKNVETKKQYRPMAIMRPMLHRIPGSTELEPGKSCSTKIALGRGLSYAAVGDNAGGAGGLRPGVRGPGRFGPGLANQPLPGGKYVLAVTATFKDGTGAEELPDARGRKRSDAPYWTGDISVETAEFTVAAPAVGELPKPNPNPAGWVTLFADEDWYKNQKGPERTFTGVLNVVKEDPNMATTLQRSSLYTLDKRPIYTGGKKVKALDALAGKVVTIRGKLYAIELEGQAVREIWPASVMEAKEPLHPIETHPMPPKVVDPPAVEVPPHGGDELGPGPPVNPPPVIDRLPAKLEPIRPPVTLPVEPRQTH